MKLIGKAKSYNDECDEYNSRTYLYAHIAVNVREIDGKEIIQDILDIKSIQI